MVFILLLLHFLVLARIQRAEFPIRQPVPSKQMGGCILVVRPAWEAIGKSQGLRIDLTL